MGLEYRLHGTSGPTLLAIHGGPAAAGSIAAIGRGLADDYRVIEPFQRGSSPTPLTVARHVADLHDLNDELGLDHPPLIGHSWGAMLILAYAAAHPDQAGPLALVGCGTFDPIARERFKAIVAEREAGLEPELERLQSIADDDARLAATGELMQRIYGYDLLDDPAAAPRSPDARAHQETWADMLRCQREGLYPAAFANIRSPVLLLQGAHDPHPGGLIRDGLTPLLPQLEYVELPRCGHEPWLERHARDAFWTELRAWLRRVA